MEAVVTVLDCPFCAQQHCVFILADKDVSKGDYFQGRCSICGASGSKFTDGSNVLSQWARIKQEGT
jgi:transcription elongation factor Elf1